MRLLSKPEQGIAMLLMLTLLAAAISTAASAQVFVFSNPAAPIRFADAEVPAATSALVFQLDWAPSPAESLQVFLNGMLMTRGVDYTLSAGTVTFNAHYSTMLAAGGNTIVAFYRY